MRQDDELFNGLTELAATSFPKKCKNCGREFQTADDFLAETREIGRGKSGLKQSYDDDESVIVELFRNCVCGSTLMDNFRNRRDDSPEGLKRREKFNEVMLKIAGADVDKETARVELLKVVHGQKSELIESMIVRDDHADRK